MINHPDRISLHNEVHARPRPALAGSYRISHVALLRDCAAADAPAALRELCLAHHVTPPDPALPHHFADFGAYRLKWERHGEFDDYTVYAVGADPARPFEQTALQSLPQGWASSLPGRVIAAVHVCLIAAPAPAPGTDRVAEMLGSEEVLGSGIADGAGAVFTDLRLGADGFSRFLMFNHALTVNQAGREVQRVIELEVYRLMAMLGFPVARATARELDGAERALGELVARLETAHADDEPALLHEVTRLAAVVERLAGTSSFRFSASRAYHALVHQRGAELRELRIPGVQPVTGFLERRFGPAMAFCESVSGRLDAAAQRVLRASALLRTRVEIEREQQNQDMLAAMNRRAQMQLRLQQTVEGFSVAAITYYATGLAGYVFKAAKAAGAPIDTDLATGLVVLPIAVAVALGVRHLRHAIMSRLKREAAPPLH
ncbi:MAG: DUF3422 domain-containing protein [Burkholderiaceae bacterium]